MARTELSDNGKRTCFSGNNPCPICNRNDGKCSSNNPNWILCAHSSGDSAAPGWLIDKEVGAHTLWKQDKPFERNGHQKSNSSSSVGKVKRPRTEGWKNYIYKDIDGNNLIQVSVKYDANGKKGNFSQKHWNGDKWVSGYGNADTSKIQLYEGNPSHNLLFREYSKGLIFIVEGESCVEALHEIGLPAVTSLGGSNKWRKHGHENYLKQLKDWDVVICPDCDEPGLKHALDIANDVPTARWLYAYPNDPMWSNPNGGIDIRDWIDDLRVENKSAEEIREIILSSVESKRNIEISKKESRLQHDYRIVLEALGDRLSFNTLTLGIELDGKTFDPGQARLDLEIDHELDFISNSNGDIGDIVVKAARRNEYNPVKDFLLDCNTRHSDTAILENLAFKLFGTKEPLHQALFVKWLISAVARAFEPGCKAQYVFILHGTGGLRKTTFFEVLAGRHWFNDNHPPLGGDADFKLSFYGKWIHEWGEVESVFGKRSVSALKSFITGTEDRLRPPYGRSLQTYQRTWVICASTNKSEFLIDETGNRRYWVVPVSQVIPTDWVAENREAIWGAITQFYLNGEQWHPTREEEKLQLDDVKRFEVKDTCEDKFWELLRGQEVTCVREVVQKVLELPHSDEKAGKRAVTMLQRNGFIPDKNATAYGAWGRVRKWRNQNYLSQREEMERELLGN